MVLKLRAATVYERRCIIVGSLLIKTAAVDVKSDYFPITIRGNPSFRPSHLSGTRAVYKNISLLSRIEQYHNAYGNTIKHNIITYVYEASAAVD